VPSWYEYYLASGEVPDTTKRYESCYFCAASRLVITPPEPGIVWSCTYWRGHNLFRVADLKDVALSSPEFEHLRLEAVKRVAPASHCHGVICNRHEPNEVLWANLSDQGEALGGRYVPVAAAPVSGDSNGPCPPAAGRQRVRPS
jgi:hypothetical protein